MNANATTNRAASAFTCLGLYKNFRIELKEKEKKRKDRMRT